MLRLAYNTNGFPQHELREVATALAGMGYDGIAITPDTFHLPPLGDGRTAAAELRPVLADLGLAVAVETGARFVLDPLRKHQPTLMSDDGEAVRRLDLLRRCHDIAVELQAETLSFWSGAAPPDLGWDAALERLCAGAAALLDHGKGSGVTVCFEPEPGMTVDGLEALGEFLLALGRDDLHVMLDVGHVPVTESITPAEVIDAFGARLGGVQLDDSRDGVHEHLFFGEGEIDFDAVKAALARVEFTGLAAVELPRHVSDPVTTARDAIVFLRG